MNQFRNFSTTVGNRHLTCTGSLTKEQRRRIVFGYIPSNILFDSRDTNGDILVYWGDNPSVSKELVDTLTRESHLFGVSWCWRLEIPFEIFILLIEGTYVFKEPSYYEELMRIHDAPFKEKDQENIEMNMNALFEAGHYSVIQ